MAQGRRVEPEGLSRFSEDVGVQTTNVEFSGSENSSNNSNHSDEAQNNLYTPTIESREEFIQNSNYHRQNVSMEDLYRSVSRASLNNNNYQFTPENVTTPVIQNTGNPSHDVPVCLHEGMQGGSPVLITLPFQTMDNLQTFVPCSTCHQPNATSPSIRASNTVAFCVSEVNIRTSQLTLVPCYLCWKPAYQSVKAVPNKITVPLFPTLSTNNDDGTSEESIRFVPCGVCLQNDHEILAQHPTNETELLQEPQLEENEYLLNPQVDQGLTESRTYFKPLRVGGPAETVREFMTQTSPNLGMEDQVCEDQEDGEDLAVAWFIPFNSLKKNYNESEETISLQRAFLKNCTSLIKNSKQRQRELPKLAQIRLRRNNSSNVSKTRSTEAVKIELPSKFTHNVGTCPPSFTHKEMRQQTEKIYRRLPESYEPQRQKLREQLNQTHRLMAYLFQKKLQRATLKGKVSWQITESCL